MEPSVSRTAVPGCWLGIGRVVQPVSSILMLGQLESTLGLRVRPALQSALLEQMLPEVWGQLLIRDQCLGGSSRRQSADPGIISLEGSTRVTCPSVSPSWPP